MVKRTYLIAALLLLSAAMATAQSVITLLNGREIHAHEATVNEFETRYTVQHDGRSQRIDNYRVFSVRYQDGTEKIVYAKDTDDSLEYTPEQMRLYIRGEQDAAINYKAPVNSCAAFLTGAGAGLFGFYGIAIPPMYSTLVGSFSPDMDKARISDPAMRNVPEFREGYQRKARDKKIRHSFISGMAGLVTGFIVFNKLYN